MLALLLTAAGAGDLVLGTTLSLPPPQGKQSSISDVTARPADHRLSSAGVFPALVPMLTYS
jgi:hypothetical protein